MERNLNDLHELFKYGNSGIPPIEKKWEIKKVVYYEKNIK